MSGESREPSGTIPLDLAHQIDQICDRYEAELAAGRGPRIEEYLAGISSSARTGLLRELLASELDWRRRHGERPTLEEYHDRFPSQAALVIAVFEGSAAQSGRQTLRGPQSELTPQGLCVGARPVPGYRLTERLGQGGFGEVWKAEGPGGVPVALKFVRLLGSQGAVETRALETIKGIRHPNLLALFGAWQLADLLVIGMELADGALIDELHRARDEGRAGIPGEILIEYLAEAAKGIDHLNNHIHTLDGRERVGVQHRDIKPQNILLIGGGVKVADFGLARLLDQSVTEHSGCLTPSFAAPEFFENRTSDQSDQYSLAVTYCYLRGGRLPFTGGAAAVMAGHMLHPPDLSMVPEPERPPLARALAKEPTERWPSCRAFVAALRESRSTSDVLPPLAPTVDLGSKSKPPADLLGDRPGRPRSDQPRPSRVPWAVRIGLVSLVSTLLVSGFLAARHRLQPVPRPDDTRRDEQPRTVKAGSTRPPSAPAQPAPGPVVEIADEARPAAVATPPPALLAEPIPPRTAGPAPSSGRGLANPTDPAALDAHLQQGQTHYDNQNYAEALIEYSEAIALDPNNASALNNRGNVYQKLGHFDSAISDYDKAIRLAPEAPLSHFNRGNAYFSMSRYEQAILDYSAAIDLNPDDSNSLLNRALAHERLGDRVRAEADRVRARAIESGPQRTP